MSRHLYHAPCIFDGDRFHDDAVLVVEGGTVAAVLPRGTDLGRERPVAVEGMIVPGFVDLQVNGGGGVLFNNEPTADAIGAICAAHARFGTTAALVTLITDTVAVRDAALAAGAAAWGAAVPGYLGLHLEGPHLSLARKGTHDPALVRPMDEADLAVLAGAAGRFGHALMTIAPESVTPAQTRALVAAGWRVSLGHTDCGATEAERYAAEGASLVTHLFNAMSQLGSREPGLVGAALTLPHLHCGLIADGHHVDPRSIAIALAAKRGPGRIFLVTDAMACTGTDARSFTLNGRTIYRRQGRLTLADGTLAGADTDMLAGLGFCVKTLGLPLEEALRMTALYPAEAIGASRKGHLRPGADADFLVLSEEIDLRSTWIAGRCRYGTGAAEKEGNAR